MKRFIFRLAILLSLWAGLAQAQDRTTITKDFHLWLEQSIWPRAQAAGVSRSTFDAALSDVTPNFDLPDLIIPGAPPTSAQHQAEFRPPARYFRPDDLAATTRTGRTLLDRLAAPLRDIETNTGVPAQILIAIWGRESSYGNANIPHNAFKILSTKGFLSPRAAYFSDELIAALQIVQSGAATVSEMNSSWAGALGQPQFMPSNYLKYAVDGDGDGVVDIWQSERDTLASIAAYLQDHGWTAGRDWGFEVTVPASVSCALEGPEQGKTFQDWAALGVTRTSGKPFPNNELQQEGYLLMPAGRYGPAFIVTRNFYVLKDYNESDAYALFVGHVGDRMRYSVGDFQGTWRDLEGLTRTDVIALQQDLEFRGFDVGGVDGLIGYKTRRSVGQWQAQNNQPETCYPGN